MPKPTRTRAGPEPAESQEDDHTVADPDLATLMAAIEKSEQSVLAKIDSSIASLSSELDKKIDSLSTDLRTEITAVRSDFSKTIEEVRSENAARITRIKSLEEGANHYSDRVIDLEGQVTSLTSQVRQLVAKTDDLESRQRRDNCRIIGVEEGFGDIRPEHAVAKLLQDALGLDYTPRLDRAHRSLRPKPKDGDAPRPFVVKFHYFQEKTDVLRKASRAGSILHNGKRFYIYPDYSAAVWKRRAAFTEVRRLLHRCPGTKFGIFHPATLKITSPNGVQRSFEDPSTAKDYVLTNLQTRDVGQE